MNAPVHPFALFCKEMLPPKMRTKFRTNWKPVFDKMTGESDIIVSENFKEEYLNETYNKGVNRLKECSPWIFEQDAKRKPEAWSVSQWSKCTSPSYDHDEVIR